MDIKAIEARKLVGKIFNWVLVKLLLALIIVRPFYAEHHYVTNILRVYEWFVWISFVILLPLSIIAIWMFSRPFESLQVSIQNQLYSTAKIMRRKKLKTAFAIFEETLGTLTMVAAIVASIMIGDKSMSIALGGILICQKTMKVVSHEFILKNKEKIEELVGHPIEEPEPEPEPKKKKYSIEDRLKAIK